MAYFMQEFPRNEKIMVMEMMDQADYKIHVFEYLIDLDRAYYW